MKNLTTLILMSLVGATVWGQNKINPTGDVGIGTITPSETLEVVGNIKYGTRGEMILSSYQISQKSGGQLDINPFSKLRLGRLTNKTGFSVDIHRGNNTTDLQHRLSGYDHTYLNRLNGYVKIGGTAIPTEALDVEGNIKAVTNTGSDRKILLGNSFRKWNISASGYDFTLSDINDSEVWLKVDGNNNWMQLGKASLHIANNGFIGIGTSSPKARLEIGNTFPAGTPGLIVNNTFSNYSPEYENNRPFVIRRTTYDNEALFAYVQDTKLHFLYRNDEANSAIEFRIKNSDKEDGGGTNANDRVVLSIANGPSAGEVKVDGILKAEEIKVELLSSTDMHLNGTLAANQITVTTNGQTADFVFEDDYELRDLQEVETFIKTNKHLPEIPSAAAMEADGVNLAEMNKLLLLKIEELTLYAIDKENRILELEEARSTESVVREKLEVEVERQKAEVEEVSRSVEGRLAQMEEALQKLKDNNTTH